MNTISNLYESDESGVVHVDVPVGAPRLKVEVVIVWQEAAEPNAAEAQARKEAELEALAGSLADDPLVRPEQPLFENRLPIE